MLLREKEIALVVKSYLRGAGLSKEEEVAAINTVICDAEIAIMEIVRQQVKMAEASNDKGRTRFVELKLGGVKL